MDDLFNDTRRSVFLENGDKRRVDSHTLISASSIIRRASGASNLRIDVMQCIG